MKSKRLLAALIPLAMLAACGPDNDDSKAATGNTTVVTISNGASNGAATTISGGSDGNQSTTGTGASSSADNSSGSGGTGGSGTGGTGGSGGSGGSGSTGSGSGGSGSGGSGSGGSGDAGGTGGSGVAGGSGGSGDAGGTGGSGDAGGSGGGAAAPGFGTVALDMDAQTVFGFGVGPANVGDVRDTVEAQLGPVTNDTDWYTLAKTGAGGTADCVADQESRILRWGDLSIAFWRKDGAESIWSWSVGDPAVSGYGDRREPNIPASPAPTGLRTPEGIAVGSTFDDLSDAYGERFQFFPLTPEDTSGVHIATPDPKTAAGANLSLMELGGPIVGIGSTLKFC